MQTFVQIWKIMNKKILNKNKKAFFFSIQVVYKVAFEFFSQLIYD